MNIYTDFRNEKIISSLAEKIQAYNGVPVRIMEVCGSHTDVVGKYGIRQILPETVKLVSGPGCPVCVTDTFFIDLSLELCRKENVIICSFGDLLKIKGTDGKMLGGDNVRVVLSPLECLDIAKENPDKEVVFLSVGFETTTPVTALCIQKAKKQNIENLSFFVSNKTMPGILEFLIENKTDVIGFLFPGHVVSAEGVSFYRDFCNRYGLKGAVCGFEPADILASISFILYEKENFANLYSRFVSEKGNEFSKGAVNEVFESCDTYLREIGIVKNAGLKIRDIYSFYDADRKFALGYSPKKVSKQKKCLCGEIMLGKKYPADCPFFGNRCTPNNAVGPCMVSEEGTCAAYFKYKL